MKLLSHRTPLLAAASATALVALTATGPAALAAPPPGGRCFGPWFESTQITNPQNPGFFARIDKNGDGVICLKDWTGPDPDPDIGFLAIDNTGQHQG
ncbi:hypothetical protein [uncultured Pseudokineococcus sp.]|uniref:hypothetical protein n=1 Tax=uncultured Pseudokineococcus sp. TaxID=1642928 RepID=UPI002605D7D8|nr:hypothetical protein [uncultured Pseudokineococcus sp.]